MQRWQIVYGLPLEVWVDIFSFPWITRKEFGRLVDRIGNYKFAEHAQFFLHEWGKRRLGQLIFLDYADHPHQRREPPPPLPKDIKSFDYILLSDLDANTLDFLNTIRPLLTDLDLDLRYLNMQPNHLEDLRTVLTEVTPLLDGIHSLYCNSLALPMVEQCFADKFAQIKVLTILLNTRQDTHQDVHDLVMNWLAQPDCDGPRLCEMFLFEEYDFYIDFLTEIREEFLAATTPSTFAIRLDQTAEFILVNGIGEVLHSLIIMGKYTIMARHPANCNIGLMRDWIEANTPEWCWERPTTHHNRGHLRISHPTIGPLDVAQMNVPPVDEGQTKRSAAAAILNNCLTMFNRFFRV